LNIPNQTAPNEKQIFHMHKTIHTSKRLI